MLVLISCLIPISACTRKVHPLRAPTSLPGVVLSWFHSSGSLVDQDYSLYGRNAAGEMNGKGNALALIAGTNAGGAGGGSGVSAGGGGGNSILTGSPEDIKTINGLICGRKWDHAQVAPSLSSSHLNLILYSCEGD